LNPTELPNDKSSSTDELGQYNFDDFSDRLRFLHRQLAFPDLSYEQQFSSYLEAGCLMFNAAIGFVVFSAGAVHRKVVLLRSSSGALLNCLSENEETIYQRVINQDRTCCKGFIKKNISSSSVLPSTSETMNYIGIQLYVSNTKMGTLCFSSKTAFNWSSNNIETLELMAEGVARMIELQTAKEKVDVEDNGFAARGIKSLDEYIHQATIPEVYGVSGRVIEVLQRRIGGMPVAIDCVAEELKLSKRTLQRRLQQQNASFAQLRDQVRYHHAINYLVRQTMSIDSISTALDFSDRTSFTNAFKRWTSLSPSTFRKLFRDYA